MWNHSLTWRGVVTPSTTPKLISTAAAAKSAESIVPRSTSMYGNLSLFIYIFLNFCFNIFQASVYSVKPHQQSTCYVNYQCKLCFGSFVFLAISS